METHTRRYFAIAIANLVADHDHASEHVVATFASTKKPKLTVNATIPKEGSAGRLWKGRRISPTWFFDCALTSDFFGSASWRSSFRITYPIVHRVSSALHPLI